MIIDGCTSLGVSGGFIPGFDATVACCASADFFGAGGGDVTGALTGGFTAEVTGEEVVTGKVVGFTPPESLAELLAGAGVPAAAIATPTHR